MVDGSHSITRSWTGRRRSDSPLCATASTVKLWSPGRRPLSGSDTSQPLWTKSRRPKCAAISERSKNRWISARGAPSTRMTIWLRDKCGLVKAAQPTRTILPSTRPTTRRETPAVSMEPRIFSFEGASGEAPWPRTRVGYKLQLGRAIRMSAQSPSMATRGPYTELRTRGCDSTRVARGGGTSGAFPRTPSRRLGTTTPFLAVIGRSKAQRALGFETQGAHYIHSAEFSVGSQQLRRNGNCPACVAKSTTNVISTWKNRRLEALQTSRVTP